MKLFNVNNFDYEGRNGQKIWCVECVSNDVDETGFDIYECENEQEAINECERLNEINQDKHYKFITILYEVSCNMLKCI